MVLAPSPAPSARDRAFLLNLQRRALLYFLDNQTPAGLMLDRQSNFGPRRRSGLCSLTATGMGFIAVARRAPRRSAFCPPPPPPDASPPACEPP